MISAFFHFQHTLNKLFQFELYQFIMILDKLFLKYEAGRVKLTYPPMKNYPQKAQPYLG